MSNSVTSIAAVQLTSSDDVNENIEKIRYFVGDAAKQGVRFVSLPENCVLMPRTTRQLIEVGAMDFERIKTALASIASTNNVYLIAGSIPRSAGDGERIYATSIVFSNQGEILEQYEKMHLFNVSVSTTEAYFESDYTVAGDKIVSIDTPVGRVGLSICYDMRFPELYRCLGRQGAEILNIPSAFTVPTGLAHWDVLLRARAIENLCYVIAPAQVGIHPSGRKTYGNSVIISPWGEILTSVSHGEGICIADIDLAGLHTIRKTFPALDHNRLTVRETPI